MGILMPNAVSKIKQIFIAKKEPMTLAQIKENTPELKASEISMALCYFQKNGFKTALLGSSDTWSRFDPSTQ